MLAKEIKAKLKDLKDCKVIKIATVNNIVKTVYTNTIINDKENEIVKGVCLNDSTTAFVPYVAIENILPYQES